MMIKRLLIIAILFTWAYANSQIAEKNVQVYNVPDYRGGINLSGDSTNLTPDEGLVMMNLVLDMPNVASARQGFSYWDSTAFDTGKEISAIYIYSPATDTKRMVVTTDNGTYHKLFISRSLARPGAVDWDTLRPCYNGDSIEIVYATSNSCSVRDIKGNDWWYTKIGAKDQLKTGDSLYTFIAADTFLSQRNDSMLWINSHAFNSEYDVMRATYKLYKNLQGRVSFAEYRNRLYICQAEGFPIIYNDTSFWYLPLIDSGTVSGCYTLQDTSTTYHRGKVMMQWHSYIVQGDTAVRWGISNNVDTTMTFTYSDFDYAWNWVTFSATVTDVDSTRRQLTLDRSYDIQLALTDRYSPNYNIAGTRLTCDKRAGRSIRDMGKDWMDFETKCSYLTNAFPVSGDSGYGWIRSKRVLCNNTDIFQIVDSSCYRTGSHYYLFSRLPMRLTNSFGDSSYKEFPRFEQVIFYNDQLYGFGWDKDAYWAYNYLSTPVNYNVIWYSDESLPYRILPKYTLMLNDPGDITVSFELRGQQYFATSHSIWSFVGTPNLGEGSSFKAGDGSLNKIISNNGIPDIDNWCRATEEYGYFATSDGVYRFNGIRAEKISRRVDPLVKAYAKESRCLLVYQRERLYVSYGDTAVNRTLLYNEPLDAWTELDFGMTAAYAMPDSDIIYFGHPSYPGYVFYYPNGQYADAMPSSSIAPMVTYESGWQAFGGYWTNKVVVGGDFSMLTPGLTQISLYADWDTLACSADTSDSTGSYVYHPIFDGCAGEYFKVKLETLSGQNVNFRGYRLLWNEVAADQK